MEEEINILLTKIESDSKKIHYLQTVIERDKADKEMLEKRIKMLEQFREKSNQQQSRILRERDGIVREMSVEIDSISYKLKTEVIENSTWKKKYIKLERAYEELEIEYSRLKDKYDKIKITDTNNSVSKKQFDELLDMYEKIKIQNNQLMEYKKNQSLLIKKKGTQIIEQYNQIKKSLNSSQQEMKIALAQSFRSYRNKSELFSKPIKENYEDIILDLTQKNLHLKKTITNVIKTCMKRHLKKEIKNNVDLQNDENNILKGSILSFSNNLVDDAHQNLDDMAFKSMDSITNYKNTIESVKSYKQNCKNVFQRKFSQNEKQEQYDSFSNFKLCISSDHHGMAFDEFITSPGSPPENCFKTSKIQKNTFNASKRLILTELEQNNKFEEKNLNIEFSIWREKVNSHISSINQTKVNHISYFTIFIIMISLFNQIFLLIYRLHQ